MKRHHTPGPWTIDCDGSGWYIESHLISTFVASVANAKWNNNEESDVVPTEQEQEANACLIAAAPDLLEALEMALDELMDAGFSADISGRKPVSDALIFGANVISKAKGEK